MATKETKDETATVQESAVYQKMPSLSRSGTVSVPKSLIAGMMLALMLLFYVAYLHVRLIKLEQRQRRCLVVTPARNRDAAGSGDDEYDELIDSKVRECYSQRPAAQKIWHKRSWKLQQIFCE